MTGPIQCRLVEFNVLLTKLWKKPPILRPREFVVGKRLSNPIIQSQKVIVNGSSER
jgi:hypothetical protein